MRTQIVVETPEAFENWTQEQLVASSDLKQAIAVNPADVLSPAEFLAHQTQEMGINPEMLHQIHH